VIPSSSLTFIPVGDHLAGKFSVFVGARDGRSGLSRIEQKTQSVSVPANEASTLDGKHLTYSVDLMMARGENILAVAVLDEVTNMKAFARKRIDVK
jgi:hypothetical protein